MRVTFVLPDADLSGGVRVVAIYAERLKKRGHKVTVVSLPPRPPALRDRVRTLVKEGKWVGTPTEARPSHLDGVDVERRVLEEFRPVTDEDVPDADVVIATWWETAEWVWNLSPRKGAKAFFIQHFETWMGNEERVEAVWRLPMHKIVISKWLRDLAASGFGDRDVSHVPNSVETDRFYAPERGKGEVPTAAYMFSSVEFKGCDVTRRALEMVKKEIPELLVMAYGRVPGEWGPGMPEGTLYVQDPTQEQIRNVYAQSDVWVCGSRAEGFHLPPLEAMACRCPVVSTRVGGPLDVVEEGKNGFLVNVEDAEALADRVMRVLRMDGARWKEMSDAAYATATGFSWDQATTLFEEALFRAIEKSMWQRRAPVPAAMSAAVAG